MVGAACISNSATSPAQPDIPAWKVLTGEVPQEEIEGRIILVGTSAPGLLDLRATPVDAAVPGIDIQTQVVEQLLTGRFLDRPDYALALEELIILALGILLAVALPQVSASTSAAIGFLTIALVLIGGWFAFRYLIFCSSVISRADPRPHDRDYHVLHLPYRRGAAHPDRHAFGQYLAPSLVEQLAQTPEKLVLGGEEREMTMLMSDVRGLTAICEVYKNDPQAVTSLINRLLTPITNVIIGHEGTIDKYIGDAVMAFWNAPLNVPEHELKACAAALEIMDRLAVLNRERQEEAKAAGQPFLPLRIGVGINTGRCLVGNLGSDLRFNYSVLGDPVNVAARLEGQTRYYSFPIIIGSKTAEKIKDKLAIVELDLLPWWEEPKPKPFTRCSAGRRYSMTLASRNCASYGRL